MTLIRACSRLLPLATLGLLLCTGCAEVTTLVKVNNDGSGSVQIRTAASPKYAEVLKMSSPTLYNEASFQTRADAMRATFVKVETFTREDGRQGWVEYYDFNDITDLVIALPETNADSIGSYPIKVATSYTFDYAVAGKANTLTVIPAIAGSQAAMDSDDAVPLDPESASRLQQFLKLKGSDFKNSHFQLLLAVDGIVVETDAAYRSQINPNLFLLTELDLKLLLDDKTGIMTWDGTQKLTDGYPGYRAQIQKATVVVE